MAEKKITPKAAASKDAKSGAKKAPATRVTKRKIKRVSLRKAR
ncbi:MAG TPA: hypothetical protein VLA90_06815 [Actinomycetota bacterium]|nr:hypothetical protein [Actinomycetota bacterium]